jgi:hypothetical protein
MRFLEDVAPWIGMAFAIVLGVVELTVDHSVGYAITCFVAAAFGAGVLIGVYMGQVAIRAMALPQAQ